MITKKRNQHYIPKFYLRNFSFQGDKKQIGVYNITNKIFVQKAKLKTQGSKNFFYGFDGVIEDSLATIEGSLATLVKKIINNHTLPQKKSIEHFNLLSFVSLTDFRNPVRIENMKAMFNETKKRLVELDPNIDLENFVPSFTHDEIINLSFSHTLEMIEITSDLDYKILFNKTRNPFISSDFPIVKYNQFLEQRKWRQSKTGYGLVGLQFFIPLNSEIMLVFFDPGIYKIGFKKQKVFELTDEKDTDQLNILQFVNCLDTIYFDEKVSKVYINKLHEQSNKYNRANVAKSELSYLFREGDDNKKIIESGQKNFLILGSSDCEIKLKISGIKIHSNGKSYRMNSSMSQLRKHAERITHMHDERTTAANKG